MFAGEGYAKAGKVTTQNAKDEDGFVTVTPSNIAVWRVANISRTEFVFILHP